MFADRGPRILQAYTGGAEVKSRVGIFVNCILITEAAGLGAQDDSSGVTIRSPPTGDGAPP